MELASDTVVRCSQAASDRAVTETLPKDRESELVWSHRSHQRLVVFCDITVKLSFICIERSDVHVSRCNTPDVLLGLGGGGGRIAYRFMSQDWLLEEVLKADDDGTEADRLEATVIDTAMGERWQEDRAADVREKIDRALEQRNHHFDRRPLTFDGPKFLPESVPSQWAQPVNWTDPEAVRELCQSEGLTSWWLSEEFLDPIDTNRFRDGVFRRRSVAKALYHIANHTDPDLTPETTEDDEVAIVTALGGGTGSGVTLDLAREIDSYRTHLYAVLPHRKSTREEKANAHAALSELEYAQLTGESPFSTITLLPHLEDVDAHDFEMAAVRTILAHQNKVQGGRGIRDVLAGGRHGPPDYAPFTVAVPHTVEYPISLQNEAEERIEEFCARKREELQLEADLYTAVETYLQESFPATAGDALEHLPPEIERDGALTEEMLVLRDRLEQDLRKTVLEDETFRFVGLRSDVEEIQAVVDEALENAYSQVNDAESTSRAEQSSQLLETAPELISGALEHTYDVREEDGLLCDLIEIVQQELENITRRRDLFNATSRISSGRTDLTSDEAELIRVALFSGILDRENEWFEMAAPSFRERITELEGERAHLEESREELEAFHDEVATEVRDRVEAWTSESTETARLLTAINEHRYEVSNTLDDLADEIQRAIKAVEEATTPDEVDAIILDLDKFESINRRLDQMGVQPIDLREIEYAFNEHVRGAKVAHLEHHSGVFRRLVGPNYEETYSRHKAEVDQTGWFRLEPETVDRDRGVSCSFSSDRLRRRTEIEESRREAASRLVDSLFETFFGNGETLQFERTIGDETRLVAPSEGDRDRIRKDILTTLQQSDAEHVDALFADVVPKDIGDVDSSTTGSDSAEAPIRSLFELYLCPIREQYDRIDKRQRRVRSTLNRLERLRELGDLGGTFAQRYEGRFEIDTERNFEADATENPYVRRRDPAVAGSNDDPNDVGDTRVLETQEQRLARDFETAVADMFAGDERAPLVTLEPRGTGDVEDVPDSYDGFRFCPVYLSRAIESPGPDLRGQMSRIDDRVRETVVDQGENIDQWNHYAAEAYDSGGPDEISMVTFITGTFLDNIAPVSEAGGYYEAHQEQRQRDRVSERHAIGLGGAWETWETLGQWATKSIEENASNDNHGAYVFRDTVQDVHDGAFIDTVMEADGATGEDPRRVFLDMLDIGTYESTVSLE